MGREESELGGVYTFSASDVVALAAVVYLFSTLLRRFRRATEDASQPKKQI